MRQKIFVVDAFTDRAFGGNPAAVCVLPGPRDDGWRRDVAREMNLSETAFLEKRDDASYTLRWFTPAVEVDLCGHATLASAHILWETGELAAGETARFHTRSGVLSAVKRGDWIEMDFPAEPEKPAAAPPELVEALGATPVYTGRNRFDYLVEVADERIVRELVPDMSRLKKVAMRGVILTSRSSTTGFDFVSRFFAPAVGVDEDPVTGSAHCCLGPYWGAILGKTSLSALQVSARGGILRVGLKGDRVLIGGQAVTVLHAEMVVG
ncbi:MAG TPA: PhzF family phenazine biosynthesis protein [Syntrophales bacterium]|nr:PhzF family phenazine biosynthesis protein [Syntrophobacterales bacterium]HQL88986.1 PhzF family phenazine biosynthesis protein [Syntrophales bacterium]